MKTKVYLVVSSSELELVINKILLAIPCFISQEGVYDDGEQYELTIQCREEDLVYVEQELAPHI